MTIIVIDFENRKVLADTLITVFAGGKEIHQHRSKFHKLGDALTFVSAGNISELAIGSWIRGAFSANENSVAMIEIPAPFHIDTSIVVIDHQYGVCWRNRELGGKSYLFKCDDISPVPYSVGAGSTFFDAFWHEHRHVIVAMELTVRHAYQCGGRIETVEFDKQHS